MKITLSLLFVGAITLTYGQSQTGDNSNAGYTCVGNTGAMTLTAPTNLTVSRTGTKSYKWNYKYIDVFQPLVGEGFVSRGNTKVESTMGWGSGIQPGLDLAVYSPDENDIELLSGSEKKGRIVTTNAEPGFYSVHFTYTDFESGAGNDPQMVTTNMGITVN